MDFSQLSDELYISEDGRLTVVGYGPRFTKDSRAREVVGWHEVYIDDLMVINYTVE